MHQSIPVKSSFKEQVFIAATQGFASKITDINNDEQVNRVAEAACMVAEKADNIRKEWSATRYGKKE